MEERSHVRESGHSRREQGRPRSQSTGIDRRYGIFSQSDPDNRRSPCDIVCSDGLRGHARVEIRTCIQQTRSLSIIEVAYNAKR